MAEQLAATTSAGAGPGRRDVTRKAVVALVTVLVGQTVFVAVPGQRPAVAGAAEHARRRGGSVQGRRGGDLEDLAGHDRVREPVRGDDGDRPGRAVRRVRHRQFQRHADRGPGEELFRPDRARARVRCCRAQAGPAGHGADGQAAAAQRPDRRGDQPAAAAAADRRVPGRGPGVQGGRRDRGGAVACAHPDRLCRRRRAADRPDRRAADRRVLRQPFLAAAAVFRAGHATAVVLAAAAIQGLAGKRAPCW